ncbi:hypothetical protein ELQ35_05255 [Peribacillus cavernae]|uniref:Asp/Glu/hydantoin racemase n=1 Tax=Peribacillus cavernae TaxID=1674310 RepID=A0A433HRS8_9BACI|nr:hypothetical protein [Peribacillus cavernae]MDQ0218788.1 aspartate/glutamate racemase [Peribacillus cavernae]RUQ30998.1 hypothetical protein ELQ35_05255 [Peribacillus cavernae]
MKKRLGCLHAHYSNIDYIENALSPYEIDLLHFVDPGLMYRVTAEEGYRSSDAQEKVRQQIESIAQCKVDAILITCTNYIAILQETHLSISVPIIKIDEPYFERICNIQHPQTIFFTNPATVEGTVQRLEQYANTHEKLVDVEIVVIENTFELVMQGRQEEYNHEVSKYLIQRMKSGNRVMSVAQLSMLNAARNVERETSKTIINPLDPLVFDIVNQLEL